MIETFCYCCCLFWFVCCFACCFTSCCRPVKNKKCRFDNKAILIVGGSEGIGLGLAKIGLRKYAKIVIIASRNQNKLDNAKKELDGVCNDSQSVMTIQCDVTDKNSVRALVHKIFVEEKIKVDYLFLNQGLGHPTGYFLEHSLETFERFNSTNYLGNVYMLRTSIPYLLRQKSETHVIIVGSALSYVSCVGYSAYTPTKYALKGLAESLENEFLGSNIHFHLSLPVDTDTPGFHEENKNKPEECKVISETGGVQTSEDAALDMYNCLRNGRFYLGSSFDQDCLVVSGRVFGPMYTNPLWEYLKTCFFGVATIYMSRDWANKSLKYWPQRKQKFEEIVEKEIGGNMNNEENYGTFKKATDGSINNKKEEEDEGENEENEEEIKIEE